MSENPDHSYFRDFSLGFNGDENVLREAFLSALLWFTHNHQRQGLRKRPNQPRYITNRYGWSSRSYRNKEKARGRSKRVPRRTIKQRRNSARKKSKQHVGDWIHERGSQSVGRSLTLSSKGVSAILLSCRRDQHEQ